MTKTGQIPTIVLLGNDPGDEQWSMLAYGRYLSDQLGRFDQVGVRVALKTPMGRPWHRWLRQRGRLGRVAALYWSRYVEYPHLARPCQADLYHILDHGNGWLIRYLDPAKTIITCHDLIPLVLRGMRRSRWPWLTEALFEHALAGLRQARVVIADSPCTRRDLVAHMGIPEARIWVVPQAIRDDLRPPVMDGEQAAARKAFQLPEGPLLLHLGHTEFYKNLEGVLRAIAVLSARGESVRLVRAGARLPPHLWQVARRLGIAERIVDLGSIPGAQVPQLYWAADVLVYPSWYEGQGLPPLEAMASGLPVVVSDRGALPETVKAAGLLVNPAAPGELADAVARILHDPPLRAALRARGLERAADFRGDVCARQTLAVYQAVLESSWE